MWGRTKIAVSSFTPSNWKQILPGLAISLISLVVLFLLVDLDRLWQALQLADYRLVGMFLIVTLLWLFIRTSVWHSLLEENFTWFNVFLAINQGYMLNNLLPFRLGEIGRALLLNTKSGVKEKNNPTSKNGFFYILSTILIERSLDLAMAAAMLLISLPFVVGASWAFQAALTTVGLVILSLTGMYILARNRTIAQAKASQWLAKVPRLERIGVKQIETFLNGLATLTNPHRFLKVIGLMTLNWVIAFAQYFMLVLAFFPQAKPLFAAFSLGVVSLGIAIPSSPGAVGIMELSMVGALSIFKLDASIALALALTAHLTNYLLTGLIGAYGFARDGQKITDLYDRARKFSQEKHT